MRRPGAALALCLAGPVFLGCPSRCAGPGPGPTRGGAGVHVPLPEGWSARREADGSLRAGPVGRTVLRVDSRPRGSEGLPSPLALAELFSSQNRDIRSTVTAEIADKDVSMVLLEVSRGEMRARALLGVKALGQQLLLCASEPGSREDEVQAAAEACRGLSDQQAGAK